LKRGRNSAGGVLAGLELKVALGRRQVLVAHPPHDLARVGGADRVGAEGVAEVVEAQLAEAGFLEGGLAAVAKLVAGEVAALGSAEDKVVVGRVVLAFVQLGRHRGDDGYRCSEGSRWTVDVMETRMPDFGASSNPPDQLGSLFRHRR
jgi:hypothetical protein